MSGPSVSIEQVATADCSPELLDTLRALLGEAFADFDDDDWSHALGGLHVIARLDERVVGHAAVVERTLELGADPVQVGYVEAVATAPEWRGHGIGCTIMATVDDVIRRRHPLGALCTGLDGFYERFGWERWTGPTLVRRGGILVRTPESDGTVMVLRHGPTPTIDLMSSIACDTRAGTDW